LRHSLKNKMEWDGVFEGPEHFFFHEAKTKAGGFDVRRAVLKALAMFAASEVLPDNTSEPAVLVWRRLQDKQPVVCMSSLVKPSWSADQIAKDWKSLVAAAKQKHLCLPSHCPPVVWWGPVRRTWQLSTTMHLSDLTAEA